MKRGILGLVLLMFAPSAVAAQSPGGRPRLDPSFWTQGRPLPPPDFRAWMQPAPGTSTESEIESEAPALPANEKRLAPSRAYPTANRVGAARGEPSSQPRKPISEAPTSVLS